MKLVHNYVVTD